MENQNEVPAKKEKHLMPVNQKSVYFTAAKMVEMIMNDEISLDKASAILSGLNTMNKTYANELKRATVENSSKLRVIEIKNFEEETKKIE